MCEKTNAEKSVCEKTGKVKLTKRGAATAVHDKHDLKRYYKCAFCGKYHVTSQELRYTHKLEKRLKHEQERKDRKIWKRRY